MKDKKNGIIIFESSDGLVKIETQTDYETVWLSKQQMSDLLGRDRSVISRHINNIYKEKELDKISTHAKFTQVQQEGGREVSRLVDYYNLDMIISVGYRVKSQRGIEFRQWATKILKEYLIDGYALNQQRIQDTPGSLIDLFKMQVELWERQELLNNELKNDIQQIGARIRQIEAKVTSADANYFTIAGYCALHRVPCPLNQAKYWGKTATKLSRERSIPTDTAHDPRFGKVRTYHRSILEEVIGQ